MFDNDEIVDITLRIEGVRVSRTADEEDIMAEEVLAAIAEGNFEVEIEDDEAATKQMVAEEKAEREFEIRKDEK